MQAVAAEFSGYAEKFHCCFGEKSFNSFVPILAVSKRGSYTDAQRLFKSFLARNELVAAGFGWFLRASSDGHFRPPESGS
jgi:hypothetical protein